MKFHEALKAARKAKKGLTLDKVASAVGVSRVAVGHWESGEELPRPHRLPEIAKAYGLPLDQLVSLLPLGQQAVAKAEIASLEAPAPTLPPESLAAKVTLLSPKNEAAVRALVDEFLRQQAERKDDQ